MARVFLSVSDEKCAWPECLWPECLECFGLISGPHGTVVAFAIVVRARDEATDQQPFISCRFPSSKVDKRRTLSAVRQWKQRLHISIRL